MERNVFVCAMNLVGIVVLVAIAVITVSQEIIQNLSCIPYRIHRTLYIYNIYRAFGCVDLLAVWVLRSSYSPVDRCARAFKDEGHIGKMWLLHGFGYKHPPWTNFKLKSKMCNRFLCCASFEMTAICAIWVLRGRWFFVLFFFFFFYSPLFLRKIRNSHDLKHVTHKKVSNRNTQATSNSDRVRRTIDTKHNGINC